MKRLKLKLISMVLLLAMVVPLAAGCNNKTNNQDDIEPVKSRVTNVYKQTDIPMEAIYGDLNEEEGYVYISNVSYSDGVIYLTKVSYNYNDGTEMTTLCTVNENGDVLSEKEIAINTDEIFADKEKSETANFGGYINNVTIMPDQNILVQYGAWFNDDTGYENSTYLMIFDQEGNELKRINASELFPDEEYVYLSEILFDAEGNILVQMSQGLVVFDKEFNKLFDVVPETGYLESIRLIGGQFFAYVYDDSAAQSVTAEEYNYNDYYKLYELDMTAKKLVESEKVIPSKVQFYNVMTGPDYDIYYRDYQNGIYACNFGDTELTELCNFINSDLTSDDVSQVHILTKDKFLCIGSDSETYREKLSILERIPDDQVPEKIVITLAMVGSNYRLRNGAIKFNKSSDEYRITFKDYSLYAADGNYDSAYTQLNNDIISGNIPDMLLLDDQMPINSYFKKGLFLDLNTMFETDTEISRSDMLENVLDALEYDGKLYRIAPSFRVQTVAGKKSILGDKTGWTMDEMMQFASEHTDARLFFDLTRESALRYLCSMMIDDFVDPITGQCSFNSEAFMSILEFVNTLSEKSVWEDINWEEDTTDFWNDYDNMYRNGTTLLNITTIYNIRNTWNDLKYTFGEEATLIGFPTAEGNGSMISPDMQLAVSAKTQAKQGAWEFIKYLLSDEYAKDIYQLPISLSALNVQIEEAMKEYNYDEYEEPVIDIPVEEETSEEIIEEITGDTTETPEESTEETVSDDSTDIVAEKEVVNSVFAGEVVAPEVGYYYSDDPMTQEEVDRFMAFLKSLTKITGNNEEILDVIIEDAAAYFEGQKSVEETAKIIQDRAMRIINE